MAPYLVLLGTAIQHGLTGSMNTTLGFHPTSTVEIVATKWRYDVIVLKIVSEYLQLQIDAGLPAI